MAAKRKSNGESRRLSRLEAAFLRLESVQYDTSKRLGRIEHTLETSSKLFELMHDRLENLEEGQKALVDGQKALVDGQKALVDGQKLVVQRLDRLVAATTRDRTHGVERIARLEQRVEKLERRR